MEVQIFVWRFVFRRVWGLRCIITAVAPLTIIGVLVMFPTTLVLTPALGVYGGFLLSAIINGYIFTQNIWQENRTETIPKITVLFTLLIMTLVLIENAASSDWTPMVKENYKSMYPAASPSTTDWYYIERLAIIQDDFINVILMLTITFIGLYIGSTLKKPTKPNRNHKNPKAPPQRSH